MSNMKHGIGAAIGHRVKGHINISIHMRFGLCLQKLRKGARTWRLKASDGVNLAL